jgi:hypothetical protein
MGSLSTTEQRKLAYFHSLGKVITEGTQNVYESKYKSSHNVTLKEVWSDDIPFADTYTDAVNNSLSNSAITFYDMVELDMVYGSNGQSYSYVLNGTFKDDTYPLNERGKITTGGVYIRPWISPVDVPDSITNEPSNGYTLRLFRGSDATSGTPSSEIFLTEGAWSVDYYSGIIHFGEGYTPINMGWGSITASFFQYSGNFGVVSNENVFVSAEFNQSNNIIIFNSGITNETIIDLSSLNNDDAFTTAYYNPTTTTITFNSGEPSQTIVDLSDLRTVSGSTSVLSHSNTNMDANNTSELSPLACNTPIISGNITNSMLVVFINGIQVNVGNSDFDDCYFSTDGGVTKLPSGSEKAGDYLYWNYIGGLPVSGYNLSSIDKISFLYMTIS